MNQTTATFKLALRYCRDHEELLRANAYAKSWACKDFKSSWNGINKHNNAKSTKFVTAVDGCSGEDNICAMCGEHFQKPYNALRDYHKNLI